MSPRSMAVVVMSALVLGACSFSRPEVLPPPADTGPAPVYVAIGASETTGVGSDQPLRDGWPRVLHRIAMPPGSVMVNMGIPGATVTQALAEEVDAALAARPNLVTVWLNVNDMTRGVTAAEYERQLESLVRRLRRSVNTRVLVANTPPLDLLPAFQSGRLFGELADPDDVQALVAAYNAAIARVVQRHGAHLVDLHAVGMAARAAGTEATLISRDGFHPSTAGHAKVAEAFAEVLRASGPLTVAG
ncbi:MAG: SGNH/GDSL hydrolase family protein [Acidimicrobiales bacterium]